jgi:hypothetical protein
VFDQFEGGADVGGDVAAVVGDGFDVGAVADDGFDEGVVGPLAGDLDGDGSDAADGAGLAGKDGASAVGLQVDVDDEFFADPLSPGERAGRAGGAVSGSGVIGPCTVGRAGGAGAGRSGAEPEIQLAFTTVAGAGRRARVAAAGAGVGVVGCGRITDGGRAGVG